MGVVTGAPAPTAPFNGGTITQPLIIAPTDNTVTDLLRVVAPAGYEANSAGGAGRMVSVECQDGTRALMLDTYGDGTFMAPTGQGPFALLIEDATDSARNVRVQSNSGVGATGNSATFRLDNEGGNNSFTVDQAGSRMATAPANPATQAFVSGAGAQIDTAHDVRTFTPVTSTRQRARLPLAPSLSAIHRLLRMWRSGLRRSPPVSRSTAPSTVSASPSPQAGI
jgi:hypothetical protein